MKPHEKRVITEKKELDEKIAKLKAFFETQTFAHLHPNDQNLLSTQHNVMVNYSNILNARIARFPKDDV